MIALLLIISVLYFATIAQLIYGFKRVKIYDEIGLKPKTKFTIIVPFRDEEKHLPLLLESFFKLNYPTELFEVILVDDDSKQKFQVSSFEFRA